MEALEHLSIMVALLLAMAAALISSDTEARREITGFFAQTFRPQAVDLRGRSRVSVGNGDRHLSVPLTHLEIRALGVSALGVFRGDQDKKSYGPCVSEDPDGF